MTSINLLPNRGTISHFSMLNANQRVSWESELFTDLTFIIRGQHFKCHQYLFASISPFLRELFQNFSSCTGHTSPNLMITLDGIDNPEILKDFLKFTYAGEVNRKMGRVDVSKFMELMELLGTRDVSMNISEVQTNKVNERFDISEFSSLHPHKDLQPYALRTRKSNSANTQASCQHESSKKKSKDVDREPKVSSSRNTCLNGRNTNDSPPGNLGFNLENGPCIREPEYTNIQSQVEDNTPTNILTKTSMGQNGVLATKGSDSNSRKRAIPNLVMINQPGYKCRKATNPDRVIFSSNEMIGQRNTDLNESIIEVIDLFDESDQSMNSSSSKTSSQKEPSEVSSNYVVEEGNNSGNNDVVDTMNSVISTQDCRVDTYITRDKEEINNHCVTLYVPLSQNNINCLSSSFNKDFTSNLSSSLSESTKEKKIPSCKSSTNAFKCNNEGGKSCSKIAIDNIVSQAVEKSKVVCKQNLGSINKYQTPTDASDQEIVQIDESPGMIEENEEVDIICRRSVADTNKISVKTQCKSCVISEFDSMQDLKEHLEECQKKQKALTLKKITQEEIESAIKGNILLHYNIVYFVCSLCYKECKDRRVFLRHIANHYKKKTLALNKKSLSCDRCLMKFFHSDLLAHHLALHHYEVLKFATYEMKLLLMKSKKFVFEHKCEQCLKVFNSIDSHSRHMNYFHSRKKHTSNKVNNECSKYNISAKTQESLKEQNPTSLKEIYSTCPYCFCLVLNSDHKLEEHVTEFHFNNKIPATERTCLHCGEICIDEEHLRTHVQYKHKDSDESIGNRNFPICNKTFGDAETLGAHMNLKHVNKDPYSCPFCHEFSCGVSEDLITHVALVHYKDQLNNCINYQGNVPSDTCYLCSKTKEDTESFLIHYVKEHNILDNVITNSKEQNDFKSALQNPILTPSSLQPSPILQNYYTVIENFVCPFCNIKTLLSKKSIIRHLTCHLREQVGKSIRLSNQRNYKCNECDVNLVSLWIINHYIHIHKWWKYVFSQEILDKFFICESTGKFIMDSL